MRRVGHANASPLGELLADQFLTAAASNSTPMLLRRSARPNSRKPYSAHPIFGRGRMFCFSCAPRLVPLGGNWKVPAGPSWEDDPSGHPLGSSGFQTYTLGRVIPYEGCKSHLYVSCRHEHVGKAYRSRPAQQRLPSFRSRASNTLALRAPERVRGVAAPSYYNRHTNNNGATNGRSLRTRRRWFAAKNPSWRSRTQSWTPHGTPPKEVPALSDTQENANRGTVAAPSQGVNRVALGLWNKLMARTYSRMSARHA